MAIALGLDIGREGVRAAVLRSTKTTLTLARYVTFPRAELGVDVEDTEEVAAAVVERLKAEGLSLRGAMVGIAGQDSIIRYSLLPPMPPWRLKLLMEYEINEVAEKAGEALTADYCIVPAQAMESGFSVLTALARDSAIEPALTALSEGGLDVRGGLPSPVAIGDALRYLGDPDRDGYSVVVDIGGAATNVAVLDKGRLVFARSITGGGELFTQKLMKHFKVSRAEAEDMKRGARQGAAAIGPVLRPVMRQVANLVRSSLNYAKGQLKLISEIKPRAVFVTGGGSRLPALSRTIGDALNCPATDWDPLAGIETSEADKVDALAIEHSGREAAVACGLAVQALRESSTQLDLLPTSLRERRTWRHRTVWLIAAGALLLIQSLFSLGLAWHRHSREADRAERLQKIYGAQVKKRSGAHQQRLEENERRESALAALGSGARAGRQSLEVLEMLTRLLPGNMTITRVSMVPYDGPASEAGPADGLEPSRPVSFEILGEVDNAQLRCEEQLLKLQEDLLLEPSIASARAVPQGATGEARVVFVVKVTPKIDEPS